jgi:PPM family protein phosphatase
MRESLIYGAATHTGLVRANNEDHYAIIDHEGSYPYALIIADGLGGHHHGELASKIAVDYAQERLAAVFGRGLETGKFSRLMTDILEKTNVKVYLGSLEDSDNHGMGTTMTMAVILPEQLLIAHVGDCRAYLLRGGELNQLTIDHTLLQEMIEAGTLAPDDSSRHLRRNVLTRALGVPEYIHPDFMTVPVQRGDRLLLCSDGLHGYVEDSDIRSLMRKDKTPAILTEHLIQLALEAGGEDNITVLAAYLP